MRGQSQILDMSNHRMAKIPKIEHKAIHTTLKGFLIQLANYIIARKYADIRLKKSKRQINRTKNFITLKVWKSALNNTKRVFFKAIQQVVYTYNVLCARLLSCIIFFSTFTSTYFVFPKKRELRRAKFAQVTVSWLAKVELMFNGIVKIENHTGIWVDLGSSPTLTLAV